MLFDYKLRRILIIGGSGLLALNWAHEICDEHFVVLGLHERKIAFQNLETCFADITSIFSVMHLLNNIKPNLVINTVGFTNVDQCEIEPDLAQLVNAELAENIAVACANQGIKLIHISTDHFFDNHNILADENTLMKPCNTYARTKAEGEQRVLYSNPNALIIRTNFYAWGTSYRQSFSDYVIQTLRLGKSILLFHDVLYTPILVKPLVRAVHDLLEKGARGIFNIAGDECVSKFDFGIAIANEFGLDHNLIISSSINDMPNLTVRPRNMSLSNKKVSQILGYEIGGVSEHIKELRKQEDSGLANNLAAL